MGIYYNGNKLLNMRDLNNKKPEIFMVSGNRSSGKTTFFNHHAVENFINNHKKFGLLYRFNYELADIGEKFFKDICEIYYPEYALEYELRSRGVYAELFLNSTPCGYALTINNSDKIKSMSHLFSDIEGLYFDEFQSETNHYCNDEITRFTSIHRSVGRGKGKQRRYVPVYMLSNTVSLINPYYTALGISERLREDTKFLRGDGFILEQNYNPNASLASSESAFDRAFSNEKYIAYANQNVYLNDNMSFIENIKGKNSYICTIHFCGCDYGVRTYDDVGVVYVSNKPDYSYPIRIVSTTEDHQPNYVMLKSNSMMIATLRYYFERGCMRFKNIKCKEALLKTISY